MKDQFYPSAYNFSEMAAVPRVSQRARTRKMKQHPGDFNDGSMEQKHVWQDEHDDVESAEPIMEQYRKGSASLVVWINTVDFDQKGTSNILRLRGGSNASLPVGSPSRMSTASLAASPSGAGGGAGSGASVGAEDGDIVWKPTGVSVDVKLLGIFKKVTAPGAGPFSKCPKRMRCTGCSWNNLFEILYARVNKQFCRDPDCCPPDNPKNARRNTMPQPVMGFQLCPDSDFMAQPPMNYDQSMNSFHDPCGPGLNDIQNIPDFDTQNGGSLCAEPRSRLGVEDFGDPYPQQTDCCMVPMVNIPPNCPAIIAADNFFDVLQTFYGSFIEHVQNMCAEDGEGDCEDEAEGNEDRQEVDQQDQGMC